MEQGYRHIRIQMGGYGGKGYEFHKPEGAPDGAYYDPRAYTRNMLRMMEHVREEIGDEVELLHDVHERLAAHRRGALRQGCGEVQPLLPRRCAWRRRISHWFRDIRQQCATRIAMGELFNSPHEWKTMIEERTVDFLRMHVSQMGGITPARAVALFANNYGAKTAWHGPGDTSPVGHAANLHLDLWAPNFGIQEWCRFNELVYEMFPGLPEVRNGYMYPNDKPGLGIDIDEELAAKYPATGYHRDVDADPLARWQPGEAVAIG